MAAMALTCDVSFDDDFGTISGRSKLSDNLHEMKVVLGVAFESNDNLY